MDVAVAMVHSRTAVMARQEALEQQWLLQQHDD
jgi:hypothetical protein